MKTQSRHPSVPPIQIQRLKITIRVIPFHWPSLLSPSNKQSTTPPISLTFHCFKQSYAPILLFLLRFPKSFYSLSNGRKRKVFGLRRRQEEHISQQQSRSPISRWPYRPVPQNRQVRRASRWRCPCLPRRRPRISRRRGQLKFSYSFLYSLFASRESVGKKRKKKKKIKHRSLLFPCYYYFRFWNWLGTQRETTRRLA